MMDIDKQIGMFERLLLRSPCSINESPCSINESPCSINESPCSINESPCSINESPVKHDEPPEEDWTDFFKFIHWPLSAAAVEDVSYGCLALTDDAYGGPLSTTDDAYGGPLSTTENANIRFMEIAEEAYGGSLALTFQDYFGALALTDEAHGRLFVSNSDEDIDSCMSDTVLGDGTSNSSDESKNWTQINAVGVVHSTSPISTSRSNLVVPNSDLSCYSASLSDQSAEIPEDKQPEPQLVDPPELQQAMLLKDPLLEYQPATLPQSYKPHFYEEYPTMFSIPCTYSSEMIKIVIGMRSQAGKMKNRKAYKRPAPYEIFSQSCRVSCQACGIVVSSRGHLMRHQTSHGAKLKFSCTCCDCSFTRKYKLQHHLLLAHGINQVNKIGSHKVVACGDELQLPRSVPLI